MKSAYSIRFIKAAEASGMSPEKFAESIRGLLSPSRCRDIRRRKIFDTKVMQEISHA